MKKLLKSMIVLLLFIAVIVALTGCEEKKEEEKKSSDSKAESSIDVESLSDEEKIEHTLHGLLKETYGKDLESAKIYVDKMYKASDVGDDETLKDLKLGEKDIAFEVSLHLQPKKGADINKFTVPDGVYDEETGWVSEIYRLGVLKYNSETKTYSIEHYGTGW